MNPKIIIGADDACLRLVNEKLEVPAEEFFPCFTIGVIHNNELIMTAVFHQYRQTKRGSMVEVTAVANSPKWGNRDILRRLFSYPFEQLKVTRLQAIVSVKNTHSNDIVKRLGFIHEGMARNAWDGYLGANIYSMLPNECKWLKNG